MIGSNSFGIALVAGRKRVPMPATGKTALRTFLGSNGFCILVNPILVFWCSCVSMAVIFLSRRWRLASSSCHHSPRRPSLWCARHSSLFGFRLLRMCSATNDLGQMRNHLVVLGSTSLAGYECMRCALSARLIASPRWLESEWNQTNRSWGLCLRWVKRLSPLLPFEIFSVKSTTRSLGRTFLPVGLG